MNWRLVIFLLDLVCMDVHYFGNWFYHVKNNSIVPHMIHPDVNLSQGKHIIWLIRFVYKMWCHLLMICDRFTQILLQSAMYASLPPLKLLILQWRYNERDGVQITDVSIVFSTVCPGADQRKHQSSTSLAFVRGNHQWLVDSPHKGPITWKIFHMMSSCAQIVSIPYQWLSQ